MNNAPRLSEIEEFLLRLTPRSFDWRPPGALTDGPLTEVMVCDLTVIGPPSWERHMAIKVWGTEYVLPTSFEGVLYAARGLVDACKVQGTAWGRPYRYELRRPHGAPRARAWALRPPGPAEWRAINNYVAEHEQ